MNYIAGSVFTLHYIRGVFILKGTQVSMPMQKEIINHCLCYIKRVELCIISTS